MIFHNTFKHALKLIFSPFYGIIKVSKVYSFTVLPIVPLTQQGGFMVNKIKTVVILVVLVLCVVLGYAIIMNWSSLMETLFRFPPDNLFWFIIGIVVTLVAVQISSHIALPNLFRRNLNEDYSDEAEDTDFQQEDDC